MSQYEPLHQKQAEILINCLMSEQANVPPMEQKEPFFLSQIVQQRIEGMDLPITFTPYALIAVNAFAKNPGEAVALLVDALDKYEKENEKPVVTTQSLCDLYPMGFYTREAMDNYIDDVLKPKKSKWSKIY